MPFSRSAVGYGGTTKGLNQIVTPDIQPTGMLSLSVQAQHSAIGNDLQAQYELGLSKTFEVAVFQGLKPGIFLLATELSGAPLPLAHGAPLRLVVPMKLGLKHIKAITDITYTAEEPADYWNERGYSRVDGL